jgi:hypothetical protein
MRNDMRTMLRTEVSESVRALLEKRRKDVLAMLASCGVDPMAIPRWPEIWRDEEGIHIDRYMRTEDGRLRRDDFGFMVEESVIQPTVIPDWIAYG